MPPLLPGTRTQNSLIPLIRIRKFLLHASRAISTTVLDEKKGDRERVVILGSGWAGFVLSRKLSRKKYQTLVISPRSHFVFTPLLNSTAVGTLEFRNVIEPVRSRRHPNVEFMQAWADDIDFRKKTVNVEESVIDPMQARGRTSYKYQDHTSHEARLEKTAKTAKGRMFDVHYDKLIIAVGCYSQTFNTPGIREHAFFMKDVGDARRIRTRVLECFEVAALPTTSEALKKSLLHFAIVGGGPTGTEFAAELSDLAHEDMTRLYPDLAKYVRVTIYDVAPKVLSMFDTSLTAYAMKRFKEQHIDVKTSHHVESLRPGLPGSAYDFENCPISATQNAEGCFTLKITEEGEIGVGMCVWATGNMANPFVAKAISKGYTLPENVTTSIADPATDRRKDTKWRIKADERTRTFLVDEHLRLQLQNSAPGEGQAESAFVPDVFALGDTAVLEHLALPATAQTANQQAQWLAKRLNKGNVSSDDGEGFKFKDMGVMTYLGDSKALVQGGGNGRGNGKGRMGIRGLFAYLVWRGAYLTMSMSWRNKILIPVYWVVNAVLGRDISRF